MLELDASTANGNLLVSTTGTITFGYAYPEAVDGVAVWSLEGGVMALIYRWQINAASYVMRVSGGLTVGRFYTQAFWVRWRVSDAGWRTLWRGGSDHCTLVYSGGTNLGFFSNRNGGWRDAGYKIDPGGWQLVIATGYGDSASSSTGTSTYYVGTPTAEPKQARIAPGRAALARRASRPRRTRRAAAHPRPLS